MLLIVIFLILVASSIAYLKLANRFNIIDKPNLRSSHTIPVIRGGGILFFIALLFFFIKNNFQYPYFFTGVFLIAAISFIDDLKTLSSKLRLPFQFIAIALLLYQVGLYDFSIAIYLVVLILGVGFINIYNFMDGINGITGMYSLSILLFFWLVNKQTSFISEELITYSILSLIVFGFYNFRKKARFFAGDIGSITMAMIAFFIVVKSIYNLNAPVLLLATVVYGADSMLTIIYRITLGEKIMEAHRHHIYQKLVDVLKISHLQTSLYYLTLQMVINVLIYFTYQSSMMVQYITLFGVIVFMISVYIVLFKGIEKKRKANN